MLTMLNMISVSDRVYLMLAVLKVAACICSWQCWEPVNAEVPVKQTHVAALMLRPT